GDDRSGGRLPDRPAALADQERHQRIRAMVVYTGQEGVAALYTMDEAVLAQELERTVNRDRGGPGALMGHLVHDFVGAQRAVAGRQDFQHAPAHGGEPLPALGTQRLCMGERVRAGAGMIVVGRGKNACLRPVLPRGYHLNKPPSDVISRGLAMPRGPIILHCTIPQACPGARHILRRPHMFKGKSAVVTGSTSGIGLGIAQALAAQGANVTINGFGDKAPIEAERTGVEKNFGVKAASSPADMTKPAEIADMIKTAEKAFGSVDILVNNAGIQHVAPIEEFPIEKWDQIIAINLVAAFHTIRAAVPG